MSLASVYDLSVPPDICTPSPSHSISEKYTYLHWRWGGNGGQQEDAGRERTKSAGSGRAQQPRKSYCSDLSLGWAGAINFCQGNVAVNLWTTYPLAISIAYCTHFRALSAGCFRIKRGNFNTNHIIQHRSLTL